MYIVTDTKISSHSTVDRFYALWQIINPEEKYQENNDGNSTVDKPLEPFARSDPHGWWTSRMIQRTESAHIPKCVHIKTQTLLAQR